VLRIVAALWLRRASGGYEAAWFFDPALILLLAYGLYRGSRICAVLLLVYVVVELWLAFHAAGRPTGLGVALLLEVSFLTGLRGTLLYHRGCRRRRPVDSVFTRFSRRLSAAARGAHSRRLTLPCPHATMQRAQERPSPESRYSR
jgi:hypothetical protein